MDPMSLDRLLDILSKADTMLTDEPARAACAQVAEALRTSWKPAVPVRLLLVSGFNADPLVTQLEWLSESVQEDFDQRRQIAGQLEDLIDEVRDRRRRITSERDALRAMVDGCREIVAEHTGDPDGDRPIDEIAAVVGYPERTEEAD